MMLTVKRLCVALLSDQCLRFQQLFPGVCSAVLEITKALFLGVFSFLEGRLICFDNSLENLLLKINR